MAHLNKGDVSLVIQITLSILSFITCLCVLLLYSKFTTLHVQPFKIIILLIACDSLWSLLIMISDSITLAQTSQQIICQVIYFLQMSSGLLSVFISTVISGNLYIATIREPNYFSKAMLLGIFTAALILSIIPQLIDNAFEFYDDDKICFILPKLALYCFFIPIIICLIINVTFIVLTIKSLSNLQEFKISQKYLRKLFIYPIIILVVFIPPTIQEFIINSGIESIPYWMSYTIGILQSSLGLADSIAYCVTAFKNQLDLKNIEKESLMEQSHTDISLINYKA